MGCLLTGTRKTRGCPSSPRSTGRPDRPPAKPSLRSKAELRRALRPSIVRGVMARPCSSLVEVARSGLAFRRRTSLSDLTLCRPAKTSSLTPLQLDDCFCAQLRPSQNKQRAEMARPALLTGLGFVVALGSVADGAQAQTTASNTKQVIVSPNAPAAGGPYSQAIKAGNMVFLAGQLAVDPATNQLLKDAGIEDQTRRALDNLKAVLEADGLMMDHIVSTTVFLKDMNEFGKMNEVYATYFKNAPPARATVEVARLPRDGKVEISAIAVRP